MNIYMGNIYKKLPKTFGIYWIIFIIKWITYVSAQSSQNINVCKLNIGDIVIAIRFKIFLTK